VPALLPVMPENRSRGRSDGDVAESGVRASYIRRAICQLVVDPVSVIVAVSSCGCLAAARHLPAAARGRPVASFLKLLAIRGFGGGDLSFAQIITSRSRRQLRIFDPILLSTPPG